MRAILLLLVSFCSFFFAYCVQQPANGTYSLSDNVQQVLSAFGLGTQDTSDLDNIQYLKRSIVFELSKRLSPQANITTDEDADFSIVNARYTDYKRPGYIVGVQVSEEKDVVETVGSQTP
jgi:hypothetical protein